MSIITRIGFRRGDDPSELITREWLVTNGLGGYASSTVSGAPTRRYHGLLISALAPPLGRTVLLNQLNETAILPDGTLRELNVQERVDRPELCADNLREFRLEQGLPVWIYEVGSFVIEKRVLMVYRQNTVLICYRLCRGTGPLRLRLAPMLHFRGHEDPVSSDHRTPYALVVLDDRFEVNAGPGFPALRLTVLGAEQNFVCRSRLRAEIQYRVEADRGYSALGALWSPGYFEVSLERDACVTLVASSDPWEDVLALSPDEAQRIERERRTRLLALAAAPAADSVAQELVLAADQFVIAPPGRVAALARAHARGDSIRSVIAGYHWFTDWGRDTMISLEGLTLQTGRHQEARYILYMFAQSVRDGLIPNMFPERAHEGLYHTADATLWFFHAVERFVHYTGDRHTLRDLLPVLEDIIRWHVRGTSFGIGVDPQDGLLRQGEQGYQLTWMDAKCDGWVVTPRRGKAVEINALWYNALCNLASWLEEEQRAPDAAPLRELAARAEASFNQRFWCAERRYLYDVVDGEDGKDDPALRPNQLFAISLPHPVLHELHWKPVLAAVSHALLTPVGMRSLAPEDPNYKASYHGDLRTRDAAYHQGTVWSWLIGPFVDAWLRVNPQEQDRARAFLEGLVAHLGEACLGSISEVFDAEAPFAARGCIAQAWGVAELLRAWRRLA